MDLIVFGVATYIGLMFIAPQLTGIISDIFVGDHPA